MFFPIHEMVQKIIKIYPFFEMCQPKFFLYCVLVNDNYFIFVCLFEYVLIKYKWGSIQTRMTFKYGMTFKHGMTSKHGVKGRLTWATHHCGLLWLNTAKCSSMWPSVDECGQGGKYGWVWSHVAKCGPLWPKLALCVLFIDFLNFFKLFWLFR